VHAGFLLVNAAACEDHRQRGEEPDHAQPCCCFAAKWSVASNQTADARFTGNLALASAAAVERDYVSGSPR
jgi:hypothetical protein